ncbi:E3 ubiquitin-protein ligase MBR2-like [Rutidosis leptorrhynchoides]|uniref:E3 ubiquitin-protein ligase MBR2-like n=1 Tax=Rutidosis leptorrhynchoides TaxID=125765 RepID=UPI003A9A534C
MRRQRNMFDKFPETVDLNEGPTFNGFDTGESDECNSRLSPTERRHMLSNNDVSGDHQRKSQSVSRWDVGESSSRPNVQHQTPNNNNWSSSYDSRFQHQQFDHQLPVGPLNLQNSSSNHTPMDVDLNVEYGGNNSSNDGPSIAASVTNSFGTTNYFVTNNRGLSSPMVNPRDPHNVESSQRYVDQMPSHHRSNQQTPLMHHVPGIMPRNPVPFPWAGSNANSRNGSSSSSVFSRHNNNNNISINNNRNSVIDSSNWSLVPGGPSVNGSSSSGSRNDTLWMPDHNSTTQQRSADYYNSWTLFPSTETDSGGHFRHLNHFPSGSSSSTSEENVIPPRHHQPPPRPLVVPDDNWNVDWQVDVEGRHMLVSGMRQILHALRRGENLRAEDYMLFDPFINGVADLHDRHRDMRLDVDNMSYEELLALEERIGDVKTGLTEEAILKSMKQRKHFSFMAVYNQNIEPCCVCREDYENGDDIGTLDCGHEFHTCCIKQWLTQKNLCPICKMTGLSTT